METEDWRRFRNPEPPSDDFDFEVTIIKKRLKNSLGEYCEYVLTEDVFNYSSGCSQFSESSDDDDSVISLTTKNDKLLTEKEIKKEKPEKEVKTIDVCDEEDNSRKEKKRSKKSKRQSPKSWSGIGYSDSEESSGEQNPRNKIKQESRHIKQESRPVKQERDYNEDVGKAFGEYKCHVCNLVLNSEVTYQTHIRGKKHIKALNAESISNIAKMSLDTKPSEGSYYPPSRRPERNLLFTTPRKKFVPARNRVSYIQELVDTYNKCPLPGLSHVDELRTIDKKETSYYCNLCSAPCSTQSIMPHLTGYKHQLRCLEMIDKKRYDNYSYQPKKTVERKILEILRDYERGHRRELILVKEEVEGPASSRHDVYDPYNQPGPSWRNEPEPEPPVDDWGSAMDDSTISSKEDLDMSRNDYYCLTCHSHMNNINMWEAHVRGKRHLKNKKKTPGESASKLRAIPCPGEEAHLMELIQDYDEPIVGLEFLTETQNEMGFMYQCHLCGACNTDNDIVDHILTTKHRTKYLEKLHTNGKPNNIVSINSLACSNKDSLIEEECITVLENYPPQRGVQVFKTKSLFPYGSKY